LLSLQLVVVVLPVVVAPGMLEPEEEAWQLQQPTRATGAVV
jgi:hypothetical protein